FFYSVHYQSDTVSLYTYTRLHHTSSSFSLLTPPPPTSTLFPYTTLFRSHAPIPGKNQLGAVGKISHATLRNSRLRRLSGCMTDLDRKSTRLNSSHGSISYAVFCLKKKKK